MSTAEHPQSSSVPAESWDDDFDFHSQSGSPKRHRNAHDNQVPDTRMSIATDDWDIDNVTSSSMPIMTHDSPRHSSKILTDRINIAAANLANWAEADPTTPQKPCFSVENETENWDDDFLDKSDSPARRSTRANNTPSRHSISGRLRTGIPLNHRKPSRPNDEDEEHESWDDEFHLHDHSPAKLSPKLSSTLDKSHRIPTHRSSLSTSENHRPRPGLSDADENENENDDDDDDDDDDDPDFGVACAEDRTVTARSCRAPQAHSPPPPVPSIPFALTPLTSNPSTSTTTHLSTPFPRSPTASVFSVPASSVADTTSLRSTAPLRPSLTRNAVTGALKYLPPSPPIHRERRRLRKKSRPHPQGVMELVDMSHQYPFSDTDVDHRLEEVDERRTPSPPPIIDPISTSVPPTPSQSTTTGGGALLSRIGSVKRWTAARKKKGSSTPSEVAKDEKSKVVKSDADKTLDTNATDSDSHPAPRPRSSISSLLRSAQPIPPPPPASSWFFRPNSPVHKRGRNSLGKSSNPRSSFTGSRSGSMTDLSMRGSIYASSSNYEEEESSAQKIPNTLVKRKSLGFVQLRKSMSPKASGSLGKGKTRDRDLDSIDKPSLELPRPQQPSKRPVSMQPQQLPSTIRQPPTQRHASYGNEKGPDPSTDNFREPIRNRKPSSVRPKGKEKEGIKGNDCVNEREVEKEEGNRGFMGNMRRLSMVGRHRRNKSGTSITNIDFLMRGTPSEPSPMLSPPISVLPSSASEEPPSLPPLPSLADISISPPRAPRTPPSIPTLLPPIELQPPSPPRNANRAEISPIQSTDLFLSPTPPPSSSAPITSPSAVPRSPSPSPSPSPSSLASRPRPPGSMRSPVTPKTMKTITSPYTASLGRSTISPKRGVPSVDAFPRRSSLSDLKSELRIPARISQAQQGLKRDLGMVRDFAVYIDQLKKQQEAYHGLLQQMQRKLDTQAQLAQQPAQRATSPSFFNITKQKPKTRARSNTNPGTNSNSKYKELAAAFYTINSKYRISWECAELLVDLADGTSNTNGPPSSVSAPVGLSASGENRGRERAITLAGDESKPPTPTPGMSSNITPSSMAQVSPPLASPPAWRASTGRHDLNHRQLVLLKEMLNNTEAILSVDASGLGLPSSLPEEVMMPSSTDDSLRVNRNWRWGDPMSSTITLPSEHSDDESPKKKRRMSKLVGMTGIRDMLRALKRNVTESSANKAKASLRLPVSHNHAMLSTASFSSDTSYDHSSTDHNTPGSAANRQYEGRSRSTTRPEAAARLDHQERGRDKELKDPSSSSPPQNSQSYPTKSSPRRPSLASIFRLGRKHAPSSASVTDLSMRGSESNYTDSSRPGTSFGHNQRTNTGSPLEEEWDRMDSASDKDVATRALNVLSKSKSEGNEGGSTLKLRKAKSPYLQYQMPLSSSQLPRPTTPRRSVSGSQLSLWAESPSKAKTRMHNQVTPRAPRLSNVDENAEGARQRELDRERRRPSFVRAPDKLQKSSSVRSMPPEAMLPESKLAMTPENIKPLLENAKEIHARLGDCIMEIRRLLDNDGLGERTVSGSTCSTSASGQSSFS